MSNIRSYEKLQQHYSEILEFCHNHAESDSISYERMQAKLELYTLMEQGFADELSGKLRPLSDAICAVRKE